MLCQEYRVLIEIKRISGMDSYLMKKFLDRIYRIIRIFSFKLSGKKLEDHMRQRRKRLVLKKYFNYQNSD